MEKQFSCDIKNFVLSQSDCLSDEPFLIQLIFLTLVLYLQHNPANEQRAEPLWAGPLAAPEGGFELIPEMLSL